jgi:Pyruvate/2-oxoacid:ferredoxin oxidoreductase gamma subunit
MEHDREKERILMLKQRGIMRRIVDKNARMVSAGYNKLIEEWKVRQNSLRDKLKFVIKALTDKDASYKLMAYNGLKQRALMLNGVGMGDAEMKKIQLIKRLTNQGYNLQVMAANGLKEFLESERAREEAERLEFERQQKEKDRILRRIMDSNVRMMGVGFRQALQWMEHDREKERLLMLKQRGIMRRIVDKNARMVSAGYNKLIEEWKVRQNSLRDKLKFVIKALTDKDASYKLMAYNGLKQRALMLSGVGMGDAEMKKIQLIKRLTNQGYNLQVMAANGLKEFLESERAREEAERLEYERQQKEKDRILRRIMDSNVRMMGVGFRQA